MFDRNILIYGAGGAGRELAFTLALNKDENTAWKLQGFIDDTEELWGKRVNNIPVLGGYEYLKKYSGNIAVTMFDDPKIRKELISKIKNNNKIKFPNLISPTTIVAQNVERGEGCIVNNFNVISTNTKLGDFVLVNSRSGIGHDSIIGDYTNIYAGVNIGGDVSVGSGCVIGSGATILPGVKIGDGSIIGGGALVSKDIPPRVVATGVPAKIIRNIS
jgi:sugar O-acyltransferase, sialic acid O-acetyltransferase NeuD family